MVDQARIKCDGVASIVALIPGISSSNSVDASGLRRFMTFFSANAVLALVYFLAGRFGLSLAFFHESASPVWPPTGIGLACALIWGRHLLPGVFVGAFFVNYLTQASLPAVIGIATGNTLEILTAALLAERCSGGKRTFDRAINVIRFILLAALPGTIVGATAGVFSLCAFGSAVWGDFPAVWLTWWLGDFVSALTIAPFLLIWHSSFRLVKRSSRLLETACLGATVLCVSTVAFSYFPFEGTLQYELDFLLIPVLLWAAYRFKQPGAASASFLISAIAIWATLNGHGPFQQADKNTSLLLLQAFMGTITITSLVLGAVVSEATVAEENWRSQEEAVREAEKKFQTLANGSSVLLWVNGTHGCEFVNRAYLDFVGVNQEAEVSGADWTRFVHPEDRDTYVGEYLKCFERGAQFHAEFRFRRFDGQWRWMRSEATPRISPDGKCAGYVGATVDITDRKKMETELQEAHKQLANRAVHLETVVEARTAELKSAYQDLEAFTYSVAHDLRAPLRGMNGYLAILKTPEPMDESERSDILKRMEQATHRMAQLMDDLLRLSKVTKQELRWEQVALDEILNEAATDVQNEAKNRQIEWHFNPLPIVECDAGLIRQALTNLLLNAVKYTQSRALAKIEVGAEFFKGVQAIYVRDNGVGFDMSKASQLFTPFVRLHSDKTYEGSGLGLATVARIIRKHGGDIWAFASPGEGATFYFTLGPQPHV